MSSKKTTKVRERLRDDAVRICTENAYNHCSDPIEICISILRAIELSAMCTHNRWCYTELPLYLDSLDKETLLFLAKYLFKIDTQTYRDYVFRNRGRITDSKFVSSHVQDTNLPNNTINIRYICWVYLLNKYPTDDTLVSFYDFCKEHDVNWTVIRRVICMSPQCIKLLKGDLLTKMPLPGHRLMTVLYDLKVTYNQPIVITPEMISYIERDNVAQKLLKNKRLARSAGRSLSKLKGYVAN